MRSLGSFQFHRLENWGAERLRNFPNITSSRSTEFKARPAKLQTAWNHMVNPDNCFQEELLAWAAGSSVCPWRERRLPLHTDDHRAWRAFWLQSFPRAGRIHTSLYPASAVFSPNGISLTHFMPIVWSQVGIVHKSAVLLEKWITLSFTSEYRSQAK